MNSPLAFRVAQRLIPWSLLLPFTRVSGPLAHALSLPSPFPFAIQPNYGQKLSRPSQQSLFSFKYLFTSLNL